jgi:hypothetical protein
MGPIVIRTEKDRSIFGAETGETYGTIDFWEANGGWVDRKVFHQIINHRYVITDAAKTLGIKESRGGGSAYLEFNADKLNQVKLALNEAGYQVVIY